MFQYVRVEIIVKITIIILYNVHYTISQELQC